MFYSSNPSPSFTSTLNFGFVLSLFFKLKSENKALKTRIAAAGKIDAFHKEAGENGYASIVHKISDRLSHLVSWIWPFSSATH